jgi:hypothetical protein
MVPQKELTSVTEPQVRRDRHLLCWIPQEELISVTGPQVKRRKTSILLGSLERDNLNHWSRDPTKYVSHSFHLKTEADPVSETLNEVHRPSDPDSYCSFHFETQNVYLLIFFLSFFLLLLLLIITITTRSTILEIGYCYSYYGVQNIFSSLLPPKNLKIEFCTYPLFYFLFRSSMRHNSSRIENNIDRRRGV